MVRAKFKVDSINRTVGSRLKKDADGKPARNSAGYQEYEPCELRTVVMSPVYRTDDPESENSRFWNASPSGKLELGCINLAAAEAFELGKEYYLTFEPAPE